MVGDPETPASSGSRGHGLRFLNEEWNESISNGEAFTLRWNQSVSGESAELGLFKISYPYEGLVGYELVSNLSDRLNTASCVWTPADLKDDLYALWLTANGTQEKRWAISPPWKLKEASKRKPLRNVAPFAASIVAVIVLYFVFLGVCLIYRRQKKDHRAKQRRRRSDLPGLIAPDSEDDDSFRPSVDSAATTYSLQDVYGYFKPTIRLVAASPTLTQFPSTSTRRPRAGAALTELGSAHIRS